MPVAPGRALTRRWCPDAHLQRLSRRRFDRPERSFRLRGSSCPGYERAARAGVYCKPFRPLTAGCPNQNNPGGVLRDRHPHRLGKGCRKGARWTRLIRLPARRWLPVPDCSTQPVPTCLCDDSPDFTASPCLVHELPAGALGGRARAGAGRRREDPLLAGARSRRAPRSGCPPHRD